MAIADQLIAARRRAGYTQAALAGRAGLPVETISRIERGAVVPRPATVHRLATALSLPADWFALPALEAAGQDDTARALLVCYLTLSPADREMLIAVCRRLALP